MTFEVHSIIKSEGIDEANDERTRQIEQLGYTEQFDEGRATDLARAAACYADFAAGRLEGASQDVPHPFWPWEPEDWKPGTSELRTLVKAMALLAAAYDDLYKQSLKAGNSASS